METRYLTLENVIAIHSRQIDKFGGAPGMRDAGLIEAALLRPQTGYYADVIEEAAALWESLTMNHGFVDGNKRIGLAATFVFLRLNGYLLSSDQQTTIEFILENLATGNFTKDNLDKWLRDNVEEKRID